MSWPAEAGRRHPVSHYVTRPRPPFPRSSRCSAGRPERRRAALPGALIGPGPARRDDRRRRRKAVWFQPTVAETTMNFRTAIYKGQPVLTWWEGRPARLGIGEHVILDNPTASSRDSPPATTGLRPPRVPLTDRHRARHRLRDRRPSTSRASRRATQGARSSRRRPGARDPERTVLFEWRSLDHVALAESYTPGRRALDYFHVNSIDLDARRQPARLRPQHLDRLQDRSRDRRRSSGGSAARRATSRWGPEHFAWQHDARATAIPSLITLFDDAAAHGTAAVTRTRARARHRPHARDARPGLRHHPRDRPRLQGSAQSLANGNVLVGWGERAVPHRVRPRRAARFDAKLPQGGRELPGVPVPSGPATPTGAAPARRPSHPLGPFALRELEDGTTGRAPLAGIRRAEPSRR